MDHVHTRKEKKEIKLNDKFQPISDTDKTLSELSLFLGTTVRDFVSLTCVSWKEVPDKGLLWQYVKVRRCFVYVLLALCKFFSLVTWLFLCTIIFLGKVYNP